MNDLAGIRILEIGHFHFSKTHLPDQTTLIWTGLGAAPPAVPHTRLTPFSVFGLWGQVVGGKHDVVVVYVEQWAPWHWKQLRRIVSWRPLDVALRLVFIQLLRLVRFERPLVVIDLTEWGVINRYNEFLLDKCALWFKRELPFDRWRVFRRSGGGGLPAGRFRRSARNQRRVETLRPLSLGCDAPEPAATTFPDKTADVFVAVLVEGSSTLRLEGLRRLRALRASGVNVDIAEGRLDPATFAERMSTAWLTWSPHGFGWDCFRHYQAPLALSVPVIPTPTIARQFPLVEGEHCFYYTADDPEALDRVVVAALADKDRLRGMAEAARAHVLAHHIWPDRIEALLLMALGRIEAPGAIAFDEPSSPSRPG